MHFLTFRKVFIFAAIACMGLVAYAYYLQSVDGLEPCPLCIFQRVGFLLVAVVMLMGAIHNPQSTGRRIYGVLAAFSAIAGGAVASYHIWLRHLPPDQVPACGPGLSYMLEAFPISQVLKQVFTGSGECAVSDGWQFAGLDMPTWALIWFAGLLFVAVYAGFIARGKVTR